MNPQQRRQNHKAHSFFVKMIFIGVLLLFIFAIEVQCYRFVTLFYFLGEHQVLFEKTVATTMTYRTRIAELLTRNHIRYLPKEKGAAMSVSWKKLSCGKARQFINT